VPEEVPQHHRLPVAPVLLRKVKLLMKYHPQNGERIDILDQIIDYEEKR
jgi:hypothetical protein